MTQVERPSGLVGDSFAARAFLLGLKIDVRNWSRKDVINPLPLTVAVPDGGIAVFFRFGVAVVFGATKEAETVLLERLRRLVDHPYSEPLVEELQVLVSPHRLEGLREDKLHLQAASVERLVIIADALAKSVLLDYYERRMARDFDVIEPVARQLETTGSLRGRTRAHLKRIGALMLVEHRMVGRAEVNDKPDILWDHPELERLYALLEGEFEISERAAALERKIDLATRTVRTLVDLLDAKHTLRVEWYIVILIVFEIFISMYELFFHG